jgi:hypothetical protein
LSADWHADHNKLAGGGNAAFLCEGTAAAPGICTPQECCVSDPALAVTMSRCAYKGDVAFGSACETNTTAAGWNVDTEAIYTHGYHGVLEDAAYLWKNTHSAECVLAFRGSDDVGDGVNDVTTNSCRRRRKSWTRRRATCKYMEDQGFDGISKGIANEFVPLLQLLEENGGLTKMQTCTKLIVTGHSLGGGLAAVFAAMANKQEQTSTMEGVKTVDYLYTFGGVPVSISPLENGQASNGCFNGARFYNTGTATYKGITKNVVDFAPFAGISTLHFPMLAAKGLNGGQQTDTSCTDATNVGAGAETAGFIKTLGMHAMKLYAGRLLLK